MSRFATSIRRTAAILVLVLVAGPGSATDQQGRYFMMGPGQAVCRDFVAAIQQQDAIVYAAWLSGYMTALNLALPDTYHIGGRSTDDQLMQGLTDWCQANPDQLFGAASLTLVQSLKPNRLRQPPP